MTNTTPDLLPCPFCGGKPEFSLGKTGDGNDWHYLECADCEAMAPRVQYAAHNIAIKEAIASAWNTRTPTHAPNAGAVKVKPLVWEDGKISNQSLRQVADTFFGTYEALQWRLRRVRSSGGGAE